MWRAVGKIMMWRCIHDGESRVVFSLKKVVCALVSANFAAARAVRVEFFHCKGGGRAAKRVIFNVISGLVFWPCCKFSAGVYPLSCSRPAKKAKKRASAVHPWGGPPTAGRSRAFSPRTRRRPRRPRISGQVRCTPGGAADNGPFSRLLGPYSPAAKKAKKRASAVHPWGARRQRAVLAPSRPVLAGGQEGQEAGKCGAFSGF